MKAQEAIIESSALQKTNAVWNQCQVNHPWSVGYTSFLIAQHEFSNLDAWVSHYFNSGDKRDLLIDILKEKKTRLLLRKIDAPKTMIQKFKNVDQGIKVLNHEYGRSWESTEKRVHYFQKHLSDQNIDFNYADCTRLFLQRVIIDTWNGHVREQKTISSLRERYPKLEFIDSDAWSDFNYGIDSVILKDQQLLAAIQIKPISYRGKKKYISTAKIANGKKWERFEKEKNAKVFLVLSDENGEIQEENGLFHFLKIK